MKLQSFTSLASKLSLGVLKFLENDSEAIGEDSRPLTLASPSTVVLLLSVLFIKDSTLKTKKLV